MQTQWLMAVLLVVGGVVLGATETAPAEKACRSVHLFYAAPQAAWFHNSVIVEKSAPGTYFCAGGFSQGYLGIQQLGDGKRLAIFSVWDPGKQDDPAGVDPDKRVRMLAKGTDTRIGRFGGEGTGGQSFLDLNWKEGQEVRFLLHARPLLAEKRTAYTAWVRLPDDKEWRLIACFSTISDGRLLKGYYAFIEDFKRDGQSAKLERRARFKNTQIQTPDGQWKAITGALFTGDDNPSQAIDAGVSEDSMFLATGGSVANTHAKLKERLSVTAKAMAVELPPLPSASTP